jgi:hypothetical protein
VLHDVAADEGTGAAKAGFAMDRNAACKSFNNLSLRTLTPGGNIHPFDHPEG